MIYVFDIDGTLVDSSYRHGFLMKNLLIEEGIKVNSDFQKKFLDYKRNGMNSRAVLKDVFGFEENVTNRVVSRWIREIESDEMLDYDVLYSDSIGVLERLSNERIIFLSIRKRKNAAIRELKRLKIYNYAEEVFIETPGTTNMKIKRLKEIKNGNRQEVIQMIGDTEIDYEAAKKNDVKSYILNRGFRSEFFWRKNRVLSYSQLTEL